MGSSTFLGGGWGRDTLAPMFRLSSLFLLLLAHESGFGAMLSTSAVLRVSSVTGSGTANCQASATGGALAVATYTTVPGDSQCPTPLQNDSATATAAYGELSVKIVTNNAWDFPSGGGGGTFQDNLVLQGSGTGFIQLHFAGEYDIRAGSQGFSRATVRLGDFVDEQPQRHPNFLYWALQGSTDYWTAPMPISFSLPTSVSGSMSVFGTAVQGAVNGSARFRLLEILVLDANGNVMRNVQYTSESGSVYSISEVPEPATGLAAGAVLLVIGGRRRGWRPQRDSNPRYRRERAVS